MAHELFMRSFGVLCLQLWEEQGLDLELIPYGCMATGPQTGFIEVVKNARTIKEVRPLSILMGQLSRRSANSSRVDLQFLLPSDGSLSSSHA